MDRIEKQIETLSKKHKSDKGVFFAIRTKSNEVNYAFIETPKDTKTVSVSNLPRMRDSNNNIQSNTPYVKRGEIATARPFRKIKV